MRKPLSVLSVLCLSATAAVAAPAAQSASVPPPGGAIVISVDANGQIRETTIEEQRALSAMTEASRPAKKALRVVVTSTGAAHIPLDSTFDFSFVARTEADGTLLTTCVDSPEAAEAFVAQSASIDTIMRIKPGTVRPRSDRE
jgi:hypothetical protein